MVDFAELKTRMYAMAGTHKALVKAALLQTGAERQLLRAVVETNAVENEEGQEDYGALLLSRYHSTVDETAEFAAGLVAGKIPEGFGFSTDSSYNLQVPRPFAVPGWPQPIGSPFRLSEWPTWVCVASKSSNPLNDPPGPMVERNFSVLVQPTARIDAWLGARSGSIGLTNYVAFVLPNRRARIREIRFGKTNVFLDIETAKREDKDLTVRMTTVVGAREDQLEVTQSGATFSAGPDYFPDLLCAFLIDTESHEVVDWANIHTGYTELPFQVKFDVPEQQVTHLIEGGESQTVEFKKELSKGDEFVESVVAFANSGDGVVLVGVDDHGQVIGVPNPENEIGRITNVCNDLCEPTPGYRIETVAVGDKSILLVRVAKGDNPPYFHRSRHVAYVRKGASDRIVGRVELDEILGKRIR